MSRGPDHLTIAQAWPDVVDGDTHLPCSVCGRWLPDAEFGVQSANTGRRGRHPYCRQCNTLRTKSSPGYGPYRHKRAKAKSCGLSFSLTEEEFDSLKRSRCVFCGCGENIQVDRIFCTRGYDSGNVQAACKSCNEFRGMMPVDLMHEAVRRLASYGLTPRTLMERERERRAENKRKWAAEKAARKKKK